MVDRSGPLPTGRPMGDAVPVNLRPFFSFYGGKWRDTPRNYPAPAHPNIVEPFAGSAGYAVRYPDRRVQLYDIDPVIVGVWDFLIRATPAEVLAIPDLDAGGSVDDLRVPQEARWLVGFWLNKGCAEPRISPSSWMRSGVRPGSFWGARVRETIARQLHAIRHWRVRLSSYQDIPTSAASTWFIDPPYEVAGAHYRYGSSGIDYADLGRWCSALSGQVIACENAGATWLPFESRGAVKTTRRGKRSEEAVWVR